MPAEIFGERYEFLPKIELLNFEEIERLARIFVGLGIRKIRITGGVVHSYLRKNNIRTNVVDKKSSNITVSNTTH